MKLMVRRLQLYVGAHWRMILAVIAGTLVVGLLMIFRLGSITGNLSADEIKQIQFASSWRHIADNPLNLPLTFTQWLILTIVPHHGNTISRAASPLLGILALAAFAYTLRRWYGVRSAIYGTIIFGFSSWFLHVSRYASFDVLYLWAVPMLLALFIAWERHRQRTVTAYLVIVGLGILLYVPGLIWLIIAGLSLQPHLLESSWRAAKTATARCGLFILPLVMFAPLAVAFVRNVNLVQTWLGLPDTFGTPASVLHGLLHSISFFVYRGPATPELWLARAPILSFFSTVMALLGVLFYLQHITAPRTRLLITYFALGAVLFALGGPITISILVPVMYLFVAAGFGYLLHEWLHIFPHNPLARGVGFGLLALAVALACTYDLKAYFIAWPHNPATVVAFHKHL